MSNRPTLSGIAAGAFVGILVGIAVAPDENTKFSGGVPDESYVPPVTGSNSTAGSSTMSGSVVGPIAGGLIGAFVGGLVGKAFRKHRWEEIPLDCLRVGLKPQRDGFSVGVKLAF